MSETTLSAEVEAALTRIENCSETWDCADGCCTHIEDRHTEDAAILRTALERSARIEAAVRDDRGRCFMDERYRCDSCRYTDTCAALNDREDG
jgi:hypothetical protein